VCHGVNGIVWMPLCTVHPNVQAIGPKRVAELGNCQCAGARTPRVIGRIGKLDLGMDL